MRRALAAVVSLAALACLAAAPGYDWRLPRGAAPPPVPADNPMSAAKVELGRRLFYDADLSLDGALACANCHVQRHAFAETVATRAGVDGSPGRRNAPGLANVAHRSPLTWADPNQTSLEVQVATPVFGLHPVEMGMAGHEDELTRRLAGDTCYRQMFQRAFPETRGTVDFASVAKALAAFQRTLLSHGSAYDRHLRGERRALSADEREGAALFQAKGCANCHSGPDLTDNRFHVVGPREDEDDGAFEKTGDPKDRDAFRTPSLRNVELTAPYLHDGSARTIRFAIFSHADAAAALSQDEATAIETFLESLTDRGFVEDPRFSLPTTFCGKPRRG